MLSRDDFVQLRGNEKIVVFIGAGVSANSGYDSWSNLVRKMDIALGYTPEQNKREYSYDDLLRIPQYLFREDRDQYDRILSDAFRFLPDQTNPIIDLILELHPKHIITTNFDHLIEFSLLALGSDIVKKYTTKDYAVIKQDSDLVSTCKESHFIKMHGDVDSIDEMVLKEQDYLLYSDKHPLTEIFIKSLLIDHTFVFIGYGLNDINFKQIMQWVDAAISRTSPAAERKPHYYIYPNSDAMSVFDRKYYEEKFIQIIGIDDLPEDYRMWNEFDNDLALHTLSDERGRNIYRIIRYISNVEIKREITIDFVYDKLIPYKNDSRIMFDDLLATLSEHSAFYWLIEKRVYYYPRKGSGPIQSIISFLQDDHTSDSELIAIKDILCKAGVQCFENLYDQTYTELNCETLYPSWFQAVLVHDYLAIGQLVKAAEMDALTKLYLFIIIGDHESAQRVTQELAEKNINKGVVEKYALLHNARHCLNSNLPYPSQYIDVLPERERERYAILVDFCTGFPSLTVELNKIVTELKLRHSPYYTHIYTESGIPDSQFKVLSTKLHNIFEYFICNRIYTYGLNRYSENVDCFKDLIYQYIDALLFLQSPSCEQSRHEPIKFSLYDIAFICTFFKDDELRQIFRQYRLTYIDLDDESKLYISRVLVNMINTQFERIKSGSNNGEFCLSRRISTICELLSVCSLCINDKRKITDAACQIFSFVEYSSREEYRYVVIQGMYFNLHEMIFNWAWNSEDAEILASFKKVYIGIIRSFVNEEHGCYFSNVFSYSIDQFNILLNTSNLLSKYNIVCDEIEEIDEFIKIAIKYNPTYEYRLLVDIYSTCNQTQKEKIKISTYLNRTSGLSTVSRTDFIRYGIS